MPESTIPLTKRDLSYGIADGGSLTYTIGKNPGDFQYTAPGNGIVDIMDNGTLTTPRLGDGQPCTWGMTVHLTDIGSTTYTTLPDIVEWEGRATSYWELNATSTLDGSSDVNAVDFTVTVDLSKFGLTDKTMLFPDSILRHGGSEFGASATYKISGRTATALSPTVA